MPVVCREAPVQRAEKWVQFLLVRGTPGGSEEPSHPHLHKDLGSLLPATVHPTETK